MESPGAKLAELLMGIPATEEAVLVEEVPLVNASHVLPILADLGPSVWNAGVKACRASAESCLEELKDPRLTQKALHRLAELSASYGLTRLHQHVRQSEGLIAAGATLQLDEMHVLVASSLEQLVATTLPSGADSIR
jgi:hypothetical protein